MGDDARAAFVEGEGGVKLPTPEEWRAHLAFNARLLEDEVAAKLYRAYESAAAEGQREFHFAVDTSAERSVMCRLAVEMRNSGLEVEENSNVGFGRYRYTITLPA